MKVPPAVLDAFRNGTSFVVATHSPLDGDALGSGLAITLALRNDGRDCVFVNEDSVPAAYRFLAGTDDVVVLGAGTVKSHLSHIFRKLDVADRTEAVVKAAQLGLIEI